MRPMPPPADRPASPQRTLSDDLARWLAILLRTWRARLPGRRPGRSDPTRLTDEEVPRVARALLQLQRGLTGQRNLIGQDYLQEPDLLGAYLLFYWPVSYTLARHALAVLGSRPRHVLDLGCGPGPLLAAIADHVGGTAGHLTLIGAERSDAARRLAADVLGAGDLHPVLHAWNGTSAPLPLTGEPDLVTAGYVLNELWAGAPDRTRRRVDLLGPCLASPSTRTTLLVLEPASLAPSRDLLALRDAFVGVPGIRVRGPCIFQGPCPALERPEGTCHTEVRWTLPDLVEDLAWRTGLKKDVLKTAWVALHRPAATAGTPEFPFHRVVSEPLRNKAGRIRVLLCGPRGRVPLSVRPGAGAPAEEVFLRLRRGDVISLTDPETREMGWAIGPQTRLHLHRSGT